MDHTVGEVKAMSNPILSVPDDASNKQRTRPTQEQPETEKPEPKSYEL